jgi:GxxExxY protein
VNTEAVEGSEGRRGIEKINKITEHIIGAGMCVHTALGPGLLESASEACLAYELAKAGYFLERQKRLPITYGELRLEEGYRIDLLVEKVVIVELKAVTMIEDIHEAQLLSYLRLSGCEIGLLINFHVKHLRDGLRRVINTKK